MKTSEVDLDCIEAYDFQLPRDLIAQHPLEHRIDARLMLINRRSGEISHHYVRDLPDLTHDGDALVLNNTKVIPARVVGKRTATGGRWEGLFLQQDEFGNSEFLSKTRGKLVVGEMLTLLDREGRESDEMVVSTVLDNGHLVVRTVNAASIHELLDRFGRVPLPPYIREGQMVDSDVDAYQTVFARHPGSVAAPTAGLHFTPDLIRQLQRRNVNTVAVTLHVGLGTFRPVNTQHLSAHTMHYEQGELSDSSAEKLRQARTTGGRVIAVGTTSTRVLESAAQATQRLYQAWRGTTNLFIKPPYDFSTIDGLLTNFHLPKSTLIVLVSAFAGRDLVMRAYAEAIQQRYRFYSYGDCMLII